MSSDIELVVSTSRDLEARLRRIAKSEAKGLGQLTRAAVRCGLHEATAYILSRIGRVRNSIVHHENAAVFNKADFIEMRDIVIRDLGRHEDRIREADAARTALLRTTPTVTKSEDSPQSTHVVVSIPEPNPEPIPEPPPPKDDGDDRKRAFFAKFSLDDFRKMKGYLPPVTKFGQAAHERQFLDYCEAEWQKYQK